MQHRRGTLLNLLFAPLLLSACAGSAPAPTTTAPERTAKAGPPPQAAEASPPPPVAATTIYVGLDCGPRDRTAAVTWIDSAEEYTALQRKLDAHAMERVDDFPELDFDHRGVVVVELGRRPTTGYSLSLNTPRVTIDAEGTAILEVAIREPAAGTVTAPMLTHPCLVAWLPRATFDRLRVMDTTGERLGIVEPNAEE